MFIRMIVLILLILSVLVFLSIKTYNKLIALKSKVNESKSGIDAQLKRRYDLIPNLVETVKGAKNFEQETLEKVVKARQQALDIKGFGIEKILAENELSNHLRQLFSLSENYPDLQSNQNFLSLQEEINNTEDRILASRKFYNQSVNDYNTYQIQFPGVLFRGLAQAYEMEFFELESPEQERENVQVKFG